MESIKLRGEYIKLGQALKWQPDYVENGGAAKDVILDGLVKLMVKYAPMRGKKLFSGDKVLFEGEEIEIL